MQYILTEEEYQSLLNINKEAMASKNKLIMDLCQKVCDLLPVEIRKDLMAPWGCIRSGKPYEWYCDLCPVKKECTYSPKNWSK